MQDAKVKHSDILDELPPWYLSETGPNFDDYTSATQIGDWAVPTQKRYSDYGFNCEMSAAWLYSEN